MVDLPDIGDNVLIVPIGNEIYMIPKGNFPQVGEDISIFELPDGKIVTTGKSVPTEGNGAIIYPLSLSPNTDGFKEVIAITGGECPIISTKISDGYERVAWVGTVDNLGTFTVDWGCGKVWIVSSPTADISTDKIWVDDMIRVIGPKGTIEKHNITGGVIGPIPCFEITSILNYGINQVQIQIITDAPTQIGCSSLWFVRR